MLLTNTPSDAITVLHSTLMTMEMPEFMHTMSSDSTHSLILSPSCCSGVSPLTFRYGNELVVEVGVVEPVLMGF